VVNVQSSSSSTSASLRCVVNLAVAPEPWLRWQQVLLGSEMPKVVTESVGLYRDRLHPHGTPEGIDGWWEVTDPDSAVATATDMAVQLEAIGWPLLDRMLADGGMLDQIRRGSLGFKRRTSFGVLFARAEALMVMDCGPSKELDEHLRYALEHCTAAQRENAIVFDEWVRAQSRVAGWERTPLPHEVRRSSPFRD
jgi:hypothetical protein